MPTLDLSTPEDKLRKLYGVTYFDADEQGLYRALEDNSYYFETYVGKQTVTVPRGGCVYYLETFLGGEHAEGAPFALRAVRARAGAASMVLESKLVATVIPGYQPPDATVDVAGSPQLPYVNGCSTKQLFPPERAGDPTLQYLRIPGHSAEQAHHIHSTVRVVWVLSGRGVSIVGMEGATVTTDLTPGKVCILEPMCPHHFETPFGENLVVIPLHVFSAMPTEASHPMFNGTFMTNQGA